MWLISPKIFTDIEELIYLALCLQPTIKKMLGFSLKSMLQGTFNRIGSGVKVKADQHNRVSSLISHWFLHLNVPVDVFGKVGERVRRILCKK